MIDMLVKLYEVHSACELVDKLAGQGVTVRRARSYELHTVADWVGSQFSPKWVSETKVAFSRQPVACIIATHEKKVIGFCCYDVTARGFVGPMGVCPTWRGSGVGKAVLLLALQELAHLGYVYAIIGGVGPQEFYAKTVGAVPIDGSNPGMYVDLLP